MGLILKFIEEYFHSVFDPDILKQIKQYETGVNVIEILLVKMNVLNF